MRLLSQIPFTLQTPVASLWMLGNPHSGSKVWQEADREIGKSG